MNRKAVTPEPSSEGCQFKNFLQLNEVSRLLQSKVSPLRAQVKSFQQQVTELRSSQGKRGKTPVAKEKTSHPRSRFHNPDTCSRRKTTITSFIRHSRPAWNSLRLKWSMRSDYMSVPTIACTTHFWSIRRKDAPPSRIDCRDTGSWGADRFQMKS